MSSSYHQYQKKNLQSYFSFRHRPFFDIKSDIPPMYGQEEFDRFMSDMITSQLGRKFQFN